ncbi:MAG: DUF2970 domain-containing protein [Burkholderiales bacterium]|nr:DUF2970 domain-containing protein [Burkholderiales bacterium]
MNDHRGNGPDTPPPAPRKAGWGQVMATMFWGLLMIGKKGTWERDGATLGWWQILAGALLMTALVIVVLLLLVHFATR